MYGKLKGERRTTLC